MLGNFHDNVISIECETNSADLYVVDAEGVYIENIAMHSYLESDVIDAINAKYGTNFTHLTMQKVTGIAIGDDCPDWNAYEKIGMPGTKVKIEMNPATFAFGEIIGNKIVLDMQNEDKFLLAHANGEIYVANADAAGYLKSVAIPQINRAGYNVTNYELQISQYQIGDVIPDWSHYTLVPQ